MDSAPADWTEYYSPNSADSTVVSTRPGQAQPASTAEGRVTKPARKRTRASRRAPTTLLNTDPANFRAMVQQFTGAPTGPYANPNGPVISFGYGQQNPAPVIPHFGQYAGQQFDRAVILPEGNVSGGGFVQGYNSSAPASTTTTSGFFLDGMMMGGNNGSGGYLF